MKKFIFDIDGTLTPSRALIDPKFKEFFLEFCSNNNVYLVTGSDYEKSLEQLGPEICERVQIMFNCLGSDIWINGKNVKTEECNFSEEVETWLEEELSKSLFPIRSGLHIEKRPGMYNFSIPGRNITKEERSNYIEWDIENNEREDIAQEFNTKFPEYQATVGGETGIDLSIRGNDKSQILKYFNNNDELFFYGDRMDINGNDYPLKQHIENSFHVKDWEETYSLIKIFN